MNFAAPSMLWWLALAVPVIALYVLKVRLRRVPVSTLMFWDKVYQEKAPRSLFERLRHLGSLLLQLLLVALLAFALADPFTDAEARSARRLVLVIDASASMAAPVDPDEPGAGSRLEAAKARAAELVQGLRHRDAAAVVVAGAAAEVACGMTGHPPTLAEAIEAIPQTDAPGAVADALALAERLVANRENGRVLLFSDREPEGVELAENVTLLPFGAAGGNVAITAFQTRRSLTDPIGYEILAEVTNFADEPISLRLDFDLAGAGIDAVPLDLAPGETWRRTFEKTDQAGGELVARLVFDEADDEDEAAAPPANLLTADDEARAVLPPRERVPVALVTPGNLFLQQVFAANPLVDLTVTGEVPEELPAGAIVVLHRVVPEELPDRPVWFIDPRSDAAGLFAVGEEVVAPNVRLTEEAEGSPLLANVRLDRVDLPKVRPVAPAADADATVLAEVLPPGAEGTGAETGNPLLVALRRPLAGGERGKAVVLAVDLDATDLPLRTAFPILAVNALTWFTDAAGELRPAAATGSTVSVPLPEGAESERWSVFAPSGAARSLPAGLTAATLGPLAEAGLWRLAPLPPPGETAEGSTDAAPDWPAATIPVAVNLTAPTESDVRVVAPPSEGADPAGTAGGRPWWVWLAAGALLLVGVEWWLYQRRFIQ
ncbi:VWA domain-containing protein [Alienimonas sp. DA493]|uniref:VWA domain-containing protein n=1 Tax=Alienimonas sp. DA493 TaxID=3373605 RepID=UPI003754D6D2